MCSSLHMLHAHDTQDQTQTITLQVAILLAILWWASNVTSKEFAVCYTEESRLWEQTRWTDK